MSESNNNKPELDPEKMYYLQRTQVLHDLQDSLLKWGKGRFWLIAILVSVTGFLGGSALITSTVNELVMKELAKLNEQTNGAIVAAALANDAASKANYSAKQAEIRQKNYAEAVDILTQNADVTNRQYDLLKGNIESFSDRVLAKTEIEYNALSERIQQLESLLNALEVDSDRNKSLIKLHRDSIELAKKKTEKINNDFENRSEYTVIIGTEYTMDSLPIFVSILTKDITKRGFNVEWAVMGDTATPVERVEILYVKKDSFPYLDEIGEIIINNAKEQNIEIGDVGMKKLGGWNGDDYTIIVNLRDF